MWMASIRLPSTHAGLLQVVGLTARCGESNSAAIQLQVVKALLTYVTGK
jgi:hypothetical protein